MLALIVAGVVLAISSGLPSTESRTVISGAELNAPTKRILQFLSEHGTSGAILFALPDKSLNERYWTWENRSINSETLFNLGSVSKQFTGFLIFQLETEKKISINQMVSHFLDETKGSEIGALKIIDLLNMTSGLPSDESLATKFFSQLLNRHWESREIVREILKYPLNFPAGTAYQYSNLNYILLGQIISRIEHKTFADVLSKRIFEPFGMDQSFLDVDGCGTKKLARGHVPFLTRWLPMPNWNYSFLQGAGGVVSNVTDLRKWLSGLQKYFSQIESRLKEARFGYSYGWSFREGFLSHAGESPGFCSYIATTPELDRMTIITLNSDLCMTGEFQNQMIALSKSVLK